VEKATGGVEELYAIYDFARLSQAIFPTKYNQQIKMLKKVLNGQVVSSLERKDVPR